MTEATLDWSDLDCFALPPLAPYAVSGNVTVHPLCATSGRPGPDEERDYTGVDLDAWARSCLEDLDALNTAPLATITRQFAGAPGERLRCACDALADAIAAGLLPIGADGCDADTLGAARALLAGRLRQRLADAYRIAAVVKLVDRLLLLDAGAADVGLDALAAPVGSPPPEPPAPPAPPFPLRAQPCSPLLVVQSTRFAPGASGVEAALAYDGEWQFEDPLFLHDRIDIRIDMNGEAAAPSRHTASHADKGLLAALAQHQASRAAVWTIVGALGERDGVSARDPDALGQAIDACAALAEQLGEVWNDAKSFALARVPERPASAHDIAYAITPVAAAGAGPDARDALIVECAATDGRCVWPLIGVSAGGGTFVELLAEAVTDCARVYRFPQDSGGLRTGAGKPLRVRFSLPSLSLLDVVSIGFSVGVTRNAQLFGRDAPPTRCAFVCHAPPSAFATFLRPWNAVDAPIDIGEWPREPHEPTRNPLTRLLDPVFREGSMIASFALRIDGVFTVDGTSDSLPVTRPLLFARAVASDQREQFLRRVIDDIARSASDTSADHLQSLVIDLTLHADDRPVLRLSRLLAPFGAAPPG